MVNGTATQVANASGNFDITFGVIIGIIVTFAGYGLIELVKKRQFKKNIRKLIVIELESYDFFLNQLKAHISTNTIFIPAGHVMITRIKQMMPENGKFKQSYYMSLTPETKASVFSDKELVEMEKLYTKIHYFQEQGIAFDPTVNFNGFSFSVIEIDDLLTGITSMREFLK